MPKSRKPRKTWRCFFCDEVFRSRRQAWLHFGDNACIQDPPACIDPLTRDEKERMRELRESREWALERDRAASEVEDRYDDIARELDEFKRLTKCRNTHELFMKLDSQEGELITARTVTEAFRTKAPEIFAEVIG